MPASSPPRLRRAGACSRHFCRVDVGIRPYGKTFRYAKILSFRGPLGPWESPGNIYQTAPQIKVLYQGIATAFQASQ